jgi:hypothetical protein
MFDSNRPQTPFSMLRVDSAEGAAVKIMRVSKFTILCREETPVGAILY